MLVDEPTANLDSKNSHHILQTMKQLNEELDTTFLFAITTKSDVYLPRASYRWKTTKVVKDDVIMMDNVMED